MWYIVYGDWNPFVAYLVIINYTGNESLFYIKLFHINCNTTTQYIDNVYWVDIYMQNAIIKLESAFTSVTYDIRICFW